MLPLNMAVLAVIVIKGEISLTAQISLSAITILVEMVYFVRMTAKLGQTLGKMAMGVMVVGLGQPGVGCRKSFLRYTPFLLLALLSQGFAVYWFSGMDRIDMIGKLTAPQWPQIVGAGWVVAELLVLAGNSKRRAIHDYLAGTEVIVKRFETT